MSRKLLSTFIFVKYLLIFTPTFLPYDLYPFHYTAVEQWVIHFATMQEPGFDSPRWSYHQISLPASAARLTWPFILLRLVNEYWITPGLTPDNRRLSTYNSWSIGRPMFSNVLSIYTKYADNTTKMKIRQQENYQQ